MTTRELSPKEKLHKISSAAGLTAAGDVSSIFNISKNDKDIVETVKHREEDILRISNLINMGHFYSDRAIIITGAKGSGKTTVSKVIEKIQQKLSPPDHVFYLQGIGNISGREESQKEYHNFRKTLSEIVQKHSSENNKKKPKNKLIVIVDDFQYLLKYPESPGAPFTSEIDSNTFNSLQFVMPIMFVDSRATIALKRHAHNSKMEFYELKDLNEEQIIDIIEDKLNILNIKSKDLNRLVSEMVRRSYYIKNPNLKTFMKIAHSFLIRLYRNTIEIETSSASRIYSIEEGLEQINKNFYLSMSLFSESTEKEIENGLNFKFNKTQITQSLDSTIALSDTNRDTIINVLGRRYMGISEPNKPISVIYCCGPTGTGKTATAKAVAKLGYGSEDKIIIIPMNEFTSSHHVNKLHGSAPGYVGYSEGTFITRELEAKYPCVLLFDEIEKAHEDVLYALLNILDEGSFTSGDGTRYDVSKCIIFMTSNFGYDLFSKKANKTMGFGAEERINDEIKKVNPTKLKDHMISTKQFKPEFVNRIDNYMVYHHLTDEQIKLVASINLERMIKSSFKNTTITFLDKEKIIQWVSDHRTKEENGRSVNRIIKNTIIPSIIDKLLSLEEAPSIMEFSSNEIKEEYV
jgi:flagellar biosynthesis GTPase FlhF